MSLRQRIHRRTYPLRVSSMALGGLVVGTAMTEMGASPAVWGFVLVSALVWPHIAFCTPATAVTATAPNTPI